jgi:hypothetical protein
MKALSPTFWGCFKVADAFAILAEDESDADVLATILKRHLNSPALTVKTKGYAGWGMLRKGAQDIDAWRGRGIRKFVICHDADSKPPGEVYRDIYERIVRRGDSADWYCIPVPVQEMEAWLVADELAFPRVIRSFHPKSAASPESIVDPKEWLIRESRASNGKPLYVPKLFNAQVAGHLRLDVVSKKCPSFRHFLAQLDSPTSCPPKYVSPPGRSS